MLSVYNQWSSKLGVLEFPTMAGVEPSEHCSSPMEKEGRSLGTGGIEDPHGQTGRDISLSLEHIWERWLCLSGDKRAESCHGASPLLKRREGQRQLLRMANLDSGFLLCFPLNSMLLHVGVTALLGQTGTSLSKVRPSPGQPLCVHACYVGSLKFEVLKLSWHA